MPIETFDYEELEPSRILDSFKKQGAVVVKNVFSNELIHSFRSTLNQLIQLRLKSVGDKTESDDLDALFNRLCGIDRKLGGNIYDCAKETIECYEMLRSPHLIEILKLLIGSQSLLTPIGNLMIRIDRPDEDKYLFEWHQDYPYNMMGRSAITVWAPLTFIDSTMGKLRVVPSSHNEIRPVVSQMNYAPGSAITGAQRYRLKDMDNMEFDQKSVEVEVEPGAALLFHSCLLHASGYNRSERSRWIFNTRYADAELQELIQRGWEMQRSTNHGLFHRYHPELSSES